ncbi:MAG: hypothetical protein A2219_03010 [Elusimicrobia bacterium RIFOXYA2_FULL_50_26]|nr:MAG: hypothetical protein A2219_03010 [Elusimicrobia bacterium RIFOXYA2_FULL_50_26]
MQPEKNCIHFGTDGWRAVIAEGFTFDNVKKVAVALATLLTKKSNHAPRIVIGYDTRFHSEAFARTAAQAAAASGCNVTLSKTVVSTPAVSAATVSLGADAGIVISASHNPPHFNGFKIKTHQGASAPEEITREVERLISSGVVPATRAGMITVKDIAPLYFDRLKKAVDIPLIKRSRLTVVIDPLYGAAMGYINSLLKNGKCKLVNIHDKADPLFGGLHPEPIEENLPELITAVKQNCASAGLATDGDGDRIGVVDDKGRYLSPHRVFPLLLYYLCKYKKMSGKVVQTISLGYVSERIARDFGITFEEVPIGFKYIASRILNEKILIGGEESGGYGYGNFLPERDGVLNSLFLMELLASTGSSLSAMLGEIEKKYGTSAFLRTDFVNPGIEKDDFVALIKKHAPSRIAGLKVKNIKDYDGVEFVLEDDSWLLLRPSGTEPIIRVYCESPGIAGTRKIINWGQKMVKRIKTGQY